MILAMMGIIFMAETLVMVLFYFAGEATSLIAALTDASLLSLLIAAPMYFIIFRPLQQQQLRIVENEEWLRTITAHMPGGLVATDRDGIIQLTNPALGEMFGYDTSELVGRRINILMPEPEPREHDEHIRCYLETHTSRVMDKTVEARAMHRDGRVFPIEIKRSEMWLGDKVYFVAVIHDISDRKAREEEEQQLQRKIEHTQRLESLGVLAGGIAHDFNNILAAIQGNAELLKMQINGNQESQEHLENIESGCSHAADLCRQMLAYAGQGRYLIQQINVSELVRSMARLIEVSIPKNVQLEYHLDTDVPMVECDVTQLEQVVINLLTNAAEAIGEASGTITITTGSTLTDTNTLKHCYGSEELRSGEHVYIEVVDDGCGISDETRQHMFEPFFTTKFTGRGLGMSAILGIMRSNHGCIQIDSKPGRGSAIRVFLPPAKGKAKQSMEETMAGRFTASGTVLVVDDEPAVQKVACRMLARMGFKTLTANDGDESLDVYQRHQDEIAVVLLDLTMPKMSGDKAFEALQRIRPDVKVLISSGYGEARLSERFRDQPSVAFVQKPYNIKQLRQAMRKILAG
ncbi:MAG: PAS domain S-box protein [Mariprofundaceae bacterium]|nr:PAS domain S-box protein [Mariprofundaceae bacterium]